MSAQQARPIEPARARGAPLAFALVYLASVAFVAATSRELPEVVGSSFGVGGVAHGFMSRAVYLRVFMGFAALVPLVLVGGLCWLPRRFPRLSNIPKREIWLAPENRRELYARMDAAGLLLASAAALFFAAMHALIVEANEHTPPRLWEPGFFVVLFAFLAITLGTALWLSLSLRRPPQRANR